MMIVSNEKKDPVFIQDRVVAFLKITISCIYTSGLGSTLACSAISGTLCSHSMAMR